MLFLVLVVLASVPSMVAAVTLDQVLALKRAGVTDAVVLALIERDHAVFTIQPEQIVVLQHEGLSEPLIIAMLKSGQAADEAARAESAYASAMIAAAIAPVGLPPALGAIEFQKNVWFQTCAELLKTFFSFAWPCDALTTSSSDIDSYFVPETNLLWLSTYALWCLPWW